MPSAKAREAMAAEKDADHTQTATERVTMSEVQYLNLIAALARQTESLTARIDTLTQASTNEVNTWKQGFAMEISILKEGFAMEMNGLKQGFATEMEKLKTEIAAMVHTQLANIQVPISPSASYAAVARTPPASRPSNIQSLTGSTPLSAISDTLYCTIDTSKVAEENKGMTQPGALRKALETEIRTQTEQEKWNCVAITKDPRNVARVRVTCRDEQELSKVKEAAQKIAAKGARVMRDQLYPVKVDNVNRAAVLNQDNSIREGAAEIFGTENKVRIAKMAWLSNKNTTKAYGSMVIYVTKDSDAIQLLQGQYFNVEGESAFTRVFEHRNGPVQCYNCQEIGHKAFSCKKMQRCAKCSKEGHRHSECIEEGPKCVPCGGPHESFSKNCRVLYPSRSERNAVSPVAGNPMVVDNPVTMQLQLDAQLSTPAQNTTASW